MDGQTERNPDLRGAAKTTGRRIIVLLWACFLLRALFYCVLFPMWEGYDEYSHFAFVQHVARGAGLPVASESRPSKEVEESLKLVPLPWLLSSLPVPHLTHDQYWRLPEADRRERQQRLRMMPVEWARQPATEKLLIYEAQQPPLYYWMLAFPLRLASHLSLPARVLLLRLLSVLLASIAIPLTFSAAQRILSDRNSALAAAALVALMPELMVDICRVGNDSPGMVFFSLLLCLLLRFVDDPRRNATAVGLGLCLGLGLLTKAYFLTGVLAVALTAASAALSAGRRAGGILARAFVALALAILFSGWWYWRNRVRTGSLSGLMQDVKLSKMSLLDLLRNIPQVDWRSALDSTFFSHIWFGNWSFLQVRSWIYHYFGLLALLSFAGILILFARLVLRRQANFSFLNRRRHLLATSLLYLCFCAGLSYHVLITFVASGISSSAGWYLYGVITAEILLFTLGLFALLPLRLRPWALPVTTLSFGLLDLYTVHFIFIPYYSGLIAHRANGTMSAFALDRISGGELWSIPERLLENRALGSSRLLFAIWAGYIAASLILVWISFYAAGRARGIVSQSSGSHAERQ